VLFEFKIEDIFKKKKKINPKELKKGSFFRARLTYGSIHTVQHVLHVSLIKCHRLKQLRRCWLARDLAKFSTEQHT